MKNWIQLLLVFLSLSFHAQEKSADSYAQIPEQLEAEKEIRVYQNFSKRNEKKILRIFLNNDKCVAELITLNLLYKG